MGLYSIISLCLSPDKLSLPVWSTICGWILLVVSVSIFLTALFVNLPFRKTYIDTGVGDKLIKTGLYSLARHPARDVVYSLYGFFSAGITIPAHAGRCADIYGDEHIIGGYSGQSFLYQNVRGL